MDSSSSSVRPDSLPVVDLRLLSQSELLSLSHCASRSSGDANDDGLMIPKIDRSVFNESAGSRKQTYSRLRLAPSAASAARRSLAHAQPPEPLGPDAFHVVGLLKQLFASGSDHRHSADGLVPVPVEYCSNDDAVPLQTLPVGIVADGSALGAEPAGECCENRAVSPFNSAPRGFPTEIVLGLLPCDEEFPKPKRGRPRKSPISFPVPNECSVASPSVTASPGDSENRKRVRTAKSANFAAEIKAGGFGAVNLGNSSAADIVALVQTPPLDTVSSVSTKGKPGRPRKNPKLNQQTAIVAEPHAVAVPQSTSCPVHSANAASYNPSPDVLSVPVSTANAVPGNPAMGIESVPVLSKEALRDSSAAIPGGDGVVKRKPGRPRKGESRPVSSAKVKVKKAAGLGEVKIEDLEKVNQKGEVVDLATLGALKDPFGEELRRRTEGLATEAELMGFLEGLAGGWGSWRRKKKNVQASEFGDVLPRGWKIQLCLKRKDGRAWLICRRYISPSGLQFDSCKEVSSYLLTAFRHQDRDQSESVLADGNIQMSNKVGSELDPNISFEDHKNGSELVSCSRVPITSGITVWREQASFLETTNPREIGVGNALKYHHSTTSFDEKNDLDNLAGPNFTRTRLHRDGVLIKDGKYQCRFCQSLFDDISHYNDHVLVHGKNWAESDTILLEPTNMPKHSPLSSSILPTSLKLHESIGINEKKPSGLEVSDNLKVDTPYQTCTEKEKAETSGTCIYGQNDGFISFSHEEEVINCSKDDKDQDYYEKQTKTSYLTNEELGKLDQSWSEMGFQNNEFNPFDVDSLNNSNNFVDMIRDDDSRNCKASEVSVSFDPKYTRMGADTVSRTKQEDFSKGSSVLSSYDHEYAFKDSLMSNKKEEEIKQDTSFQTEQAGRSEHTRCYDFMGNKKILSSDSMESSRNKEVQSFWSDEALHDSGSVDPVIDPNVGKSIVSGRSLERLSPVISRSDQTFPVPNKVPGNSSNREQDLTRHSEFGLIYPSGAGQIHAVDATQNMFTNTMWDQPKLVTNQFKRNELATGSVLDSRPSGYDMPDLTWRTDDQNFRPSRLTDTSSVQMSGGFPNFSLMPDKDVYGNAGVGERLDDFSGFLGLQPGSTQQQLQYDFLSAQGTSNSNYSRDLSHKQDYDSFLWFSKEDTSSFSRTAGTPPPLTICFWCRKEFYRQDVGSQMKSGSMGIMCATCQNKFPG